MFSFRQWLVGERIPPSSREVAERERLLHALIDKLGTKIFALDFRGQIEFWSQGMVDLTGHKRVAVLGKKIEKVLPLQNADTSLQGQFWEAIKSRERVTQEYSYQNRPVQLTLSPLFSREGEIIGVLGELIDITLEKQVEAMKIDFVNIVSHELRAPISAIKGYLSTVLEEADYLAPEHREYLQRAYESNERQLVTVESLLNVSRIERGTIKVEQRVFHLEEIIYEVVDEFRRVAREKKLELSFIPPHLPLPPVKADPVKTREVLSNLIDNALKYTYRGSVIVSVKQEGRYLWTQVKDTGIGIPLEKQKHLFEKFVRGERSLTEESPGTGLGLYIVKNFVELMGGKVEFESIENHGTTFRFSLPQAKE